ncbi:MAG: hypothetical protein OXL97_10235 [Chloroflexota bacterium]|nr:hypothetical protein [Chloroflexota bacterium]MDE2886216.1 hypothetical protein [Chloroflexota bacterium]
MLIAALIFGVLGGIVGLFIGALVFIGDLVDFAFRGGDTNTAGLLVLFFALLAIAGAVMCLKRPWHGAALMFLSGVGSMIVINIFGAPVFFLTLLAAFSAVRGRREVRR